MCVNLIWFRKELGKIKRNRGTKDPESVEHSNDYDQNDMESYKAFIKNHVMQIRGELMNIINSSSREAR